MIASCSWDNTLLIYDIRRKSTVKSIIGPLVCCHDGLDIRGDGILLTGSYRAEDCLQMWDLRTFECFKTVDWDGAGL